MSEHDWINWTGGENPVPGQTVDVCFRGESAEPFFPSTDLYWFHDGASYDIIAYRVVQPAPTMSDTDETVGLDWSEHEDEISEAICDSMDMDWTSRDGARAVIRYLQSLSLSAPTAESKLWEALEQIQGGLRHLRATERLSEMRRIARTALSAERKLRELLKRADDELRLIRAKDTNAVYDTTLRLDISLALREAEGGVK